MSDMNRRDFVAASAASVALVVLGSEVLGQPAPTTSSTTVDIGTPADFAEGAMSDKFVRSDKILVARVKDKIYAMTSVCTHRKSAVTVSDGKFRCPSHNSFFGADGKPTAGPAKDPLARHAIALNDQGHLIVDTSKTFEEAKWSDPAAFFAVKKATT